MDVKFRTRTNIRDRYGFDWVLTSCERCGLEWQTEPLVPEARAAFYGTGEYRRLCEQVTGKPWTQAWYLREQQREYSLKWLDRFAELPGGRWLDYGGSTGIVSAHASSVAQGPAEIIVADYGDGAPVTPERGMKMGPYDVIICAQTLDHLHNPLQTLRMFHKIAQRFGWLFVDVVKKEHTQYKIDHDTYWQERTISACVERAGWTIQWFDGTTNPTHWTVGARAEHDHWNVIGERKQIKEHRKTGSVWGGWKP